MQTCPPASHWVNAAPSSVAKRMRWPPWRQWTPVTTTTQTTRGACVSIFLYFSLFSSFFRVLPGSVLSAGWMGARTVESYAALMVR
jgi:hypothetical protein